MTIEDDNPSERAGEYVLGTLSKAEREAFEMELAGSATLRAEVRDWDRRLSPLTVMIAEETPSASVWSAIEQRLEGADIAPRATAKIIQLKRSVLRWRGMSIAAGALAAALALILILDPGWLRLRQPQDYIAVVNRGGDLPALIVQVDEREGVVQVRSLAAETPPDKSLELWYVAAGAVPKSLGLVEKASARVAIPSALRGAAIAGGTIAVTNEPKGGSPTGLPTGPIVYSGKLIKTQP